MSNEIAKEPSASMAVENAENVIKAELDKLKRKLEETEAELENEKKSKQKLKETEAELERYKALVAMGVKSKSKRVRICLTLTKCAELFSKKGFSIFSSPVNLGGFQWKLEAKEHPDGFLGLFLNLYPPEHHKGPFEFDVNESFRVLNVFLEKDITKQWPNKFNDKNKGWGFTKVIETEDLLNPAKGFLHDDDTIRVEVDFTVVQIAALDNRG